MPDPSPDPGADEPPAPSKGRAHCLQEGLGKLKPVLQLLSAASATTQPISLHLPDTPATETEPHQITQQVHSFLQVHYKANPPIQTHNSILLKTNHSKGCSNS